MTNQEPERQFWKIPTNKMDFADFIRAVKYEVSERKSGDTYIIKKDDGLEITIGPFSEMSEGDPRIEINYDPTSFIQVEYALEFRKILDQNKLKYTEVPPREEVVETIARESSKLKKLILGRRK
jgi:hypothetical protein